MFDELWERKERIEIDEIEDVKLTVTAFLESVNNIFQATYYDVTVEGEVSGFKINQGKWVFFDLKDEESSVSCFLPLSMLRMELEDGMKIVVRGMPKVTKWGKFSLTVKRMTPVGEGSIKKSFELLKKKLTAEGLFDLARKRRLPENLRKIGVISSTQAAGYADFCKILNARWGGLEVQTAHTQVQGLDAPDQIVRALKYFNEKAEVDVVAIIRGGGSADDLAAFNDEKLVREIAASRIPVITGIGHEIDESLSDLAADVRASTPSNVAEMLTRDKRAELNNIRTMINKISTRIRQEIDYRGDNVRTSIAEVGRTLRMKIEGVEQKICSQVKILKGANPNLTLKRGYAIVSGKIEDGEEVEITMYEKIAQAKIINIKERK